MTEGVLSGICVLDFGRFVAGPFCAALLGDLGADVIRIERPGGGEDRHIYPVTEAQEGALFLQMNRNKRSLALDLKAPEAPDIMRRLVECSGVVIANLPEAGLRDLGLDYASLRRIREDVILTAISAFGKTGPYAAKVGFDSMGQAMSGSAYLSGFDVPTKSYASWVDLATAAFAAFGTLAAIHERSRTGQGQEVGASLLASALTVMNFPLIEEALAGVGRGRKGNQGQSGGPADIFQADDGWIAVQVISDPIFRRWARLMGEPCWLEDARFASDAARAVNADPSARMAEWCRTRSVEDALTELAAARIPAAPVLSPAEVLAHPQMEAGGFFEAMDYPGAPRPAPLVLKAVEMSATPPRLHTRAPMAGEHTEQILGELGFTPKEVEGLRSRAVI